jgi:8-oxo-dGTP pyrophosphatase MutT (NUDIX family)
MPPVIRARRLAYRVAAQLLRVVRMLVPIDWGGVKCVLTDGDRVLLVRHTYGRRAWDVPGGSMKRGESPLSAARREMSEELGLDGADWTEIGELHGRADRRHDTIHCFRVELSAPTLTIDPGELAAAGWFTRDELPEDLGPYVGEIITRAPAISGEPQG